MTTTHINGKEYRLKARIGDVNRLVAKYKNEIDRMWKKTKNADVPLDDKKTGEFILEMVWMFICPRYLFLKPFITFRRFSLNIELADLNRVAERSFLLLHGIEPDEFLKNEEGKERGN